MSLIQQQNIARTGEVELSNKVGDIKQKYSSVNVKQLLDDLQQVKAENDELLKQLKGMEK